MLWVTHLVFLSIKAIKLFALALLISGVYLAHHALFPEYEADASTQIEGRVIASFDNRVLVRLTNNQRIYVYHEDAMHVCAGAQVFAEGAMRQSGHAMMPGAFDYDAYLRSIRISGVFYAETLESTEAQFSLHTLRGTIERRIERGYKEKVSAYLKMFVLAERGDVDETISERASKLGIAHLFAVSGLHISLIALGIKKGLAFLKVNALTADVIVSILLLMFLVVTFFATSVIRASAMAVLLIVNRRTKLEFTPVDVWALLCVGLLLWNPYYYVQTGFILTFIVTGSLLLSRPFLEKGSKISQLMKVSLVSFLVTLPIVSGFNYAVNPFTVFLNIPFVLYTTMVLLPLGYITFFLQILAPVYGIIIEGFENMVNGAYNVLHVPFPLVFNPKWTIVIYYGVCWWFFIGIERSDYHKRAIGIIAVVLLVHLAPLWQHKTRVVFFHVHGDSILLQDAYNQCNMLIDTGERDQRNHVVNALKTLHVRRLDYVFITHKHSDHYGAYESIAKHVMVHTLITNENVDMFGYEPFQCGKFTVEILPLEFPHWGENDRSLVKRITVYGDVYLFTGDIEAPREATLPLEQLHANILKVPHHGSHTSTTEPFLRAVNPNIAIIPAHRDNRFNHPDSTVVNRLEAFGIDLYTTGVDGTIFIEYRFNKRTKSTPYRP